MSRSPATISSLWLLCISDLVKATTPHITHLVQLHLGHSQIPKSWICSTASISRSFQSNFLWFLPWGRFFSKLPSTWKGVVNANMGELPLLKCKILLFKGEVRNEGESACFLFQKEKKVSIDYAFPSTSVILRWFWRPRARLSSMFSFLPVRGSLPSCLPTSVWQSTRRVSGSEWEDWYPSYTSYLLCTLNKSVSLDFLAS